MQPFAIAGKVVLITGAGRGIGKGIAEVLTEAGAEMALTALTPQYVKPLADQLERASGRQVLAFAADATIAQDMQKVVRETTERLGHIDVLINTVGDAIRSAVVSLPQTEGSRQPPDAMTDERWRQIIDVNLTQAFVGSRAVGPHFLERRQGKVINIASFAALRGGAFLTAYAAAKAGVVAFTRALALEWAPYGVTVNAIAPGSFPDPDQLAPEALARLQSQPRTDIPLGRVGNLREVGYLTLYLASDASNYLTGQTIFLDGGMTL